MLSLKSRVFRIPDALWSEVDGDLVIMDVDSGSYYNLDAIGAEIWNRIADPIEIDRLCVELSGDFDADLEVIRADVLVLFERMAEKGLVRVEARHAAD